MKPSYSILWARNILMILVRTSEMFYRNLQIPWWAETIPFTNHKNKYFIVQMVAYTIVHVNRVKV